MKRLWTLFINPWFFMIAGGSCLALMAMDYAMHKNCDPTEFWYCLSHVGITFGIIGGVFVFGNILIRICIVLWDGIKWLWGKLMSAVTL